MPAPPHSLALVITELDVGGAERCLARLACGLDRHQFAPRVLALGPPPEPPRDELVRLLAEHEVPIRFLGLRRGRQFPRAVQQLRHELRAQRAAVAQAFLYHANVVTAVAAPLAGTPACCLGIRVSDPSRWRQLVERQLVGRADRVVCVSQSVADFARQRLGVASARLVVIPNGIEVVDVTARRPADLRKFGLAAGRRTLVWAGRLTPQKGLDQLLHLAPTLLTQLPDYDLLLVGDGPDRSSLEQQVARLGLQPRVRFAGWQPDVQEILLASHLLVLPSRWEGMPNILLEAMACRLPVLCAPAEGVRQVLGPLWEPQVASLDSPQVFVEKAVAIAGDPRSQDLLGAENQRRVRDHFSVDAMVQAYQDLFQTLIGLSARG